MNILRRVLVVIVAAIVAMASGVLVAHADSTPTVYNTPGGRESLVAGCGTPPVRSTRATWCGVVPRSGPRRCAT